MKKRPLILRTVIALVVIGVFTFSIHPLMPLDFFDTFRSILKDPNDPEVNGLIEQAKTMVAQNPELYNIQALLTVAENQGIELKDKVHGSDLEDNRDVMNLVRKKASSSIRLGLDLNGGVEFVLLLQPDEDFLKKLEALGQDGKSDRAEVEKRMRAEFDRYRDLAIEILRKRLEQQKIYEAEISPTGSEYVSIKAPIVIKDEKLKLLNLISMSAKLNFRLVAENNAELVSEYLKDPDHFVVPPGLELMTTSRLQPGQPPQKDYFFVEIRPQMDGRGISDARPNRNQFGQREIMMSFNQEGAQRFAEVTGANIGRQLAVVLDDKLYCAPTINTAIPGGSAVITGQFSEEECKNISDALVSGSFPFKIKVDAVFDTDPKLGADNVANGVWVGVIALIAVALFMAAYYLRAGLVAVVALIVNVVLILGAMAAFDCTLTLPGIAGIVLTIGMAVDANVLVFERIREELASGKNLSSAVQLGFSRAYSAVLDANLTTLITSVILLYIGTGPIKGFAVTLSIGILTSLFTALFLSRLIFDYMDRFCHFTGLKMCQAFHNPHFNFVRTFKPALMISCVLAVLSIAVVFVRGRDCLSVDFLGGTMMTFSYDQMVSLDAVTKTLKANGIEAVVTYKSNSAAADSRQLEILMRDPDSAVQDPLATVSELLNRTYPELKLNNGNETTVGGLIGKEFSRTAILALILATIGIGVYVTLRYEFSYAMASSAALAHDVIIVTGIFLATGREISLSVVAALLTVIGYSMNDKVVVFDRIRENVNLGVPGTYNDIISLSLNQTLNRTLLTSLTTLVVVVVLYIWGGVAINDFVFVMLLGIIVGTYSSIYVATPIISIWHKRIARLDQPTSAKAVRSAR